MSRRLELQALLNDILGSSNVYFQPPSTLKMSYPCIVYELMGYEIDHANNKKFIVRQHWKITCISKNPEDPVPNEIMKLPFSSFDRSYTMDNLNHSILLLHF